MIADQHTTGEDLIETRVWQIEVQAVKYKPSLSLIAQSTGLRP
jgi:hypothetical protein